MKRFNRLLANNQLLFYITLAIGILYSLVCVVAPTISGQMINDILSQSSMRVTAILPFLGVSVLQIALSIADTHSGNRLLIRQKETMRDRAYTSFLPQSHGEQSKISDFVSFVNNDIPNVADRYVRGTIDIAKCLTLIAFTSLSLLACHWSLGVMILGISLLIVLLPTTLRNRGMEAQRVYSLSNSHYNVILQSLLKGAFLLVGYGCLPYARQSAEKANARLSRDEVVLYNWQMVALGITTVLQVVKTAGVLVLGLYLISTQTITVGALVAAIQLSAMIGAPIEVLASLRHSRNAMASLVERYETLAAAVPESGGTQLPQSPFQQLEVRHLSFAAAGRDILRDVSLVFAQRGKYLITGESGSGKSTLLRLLAQLETPCGQGSILYNGTDIRDLDRAAYCGKVRYVPQQPCIFFASLRENICLGRDVPEQTYQALIEKLNLRYLLDRYGGRELTPQDMEAISGGEQQRIALARALVGEAEVYLLDEVTSALDPGNAHLVESVLLEQPATVIHVCHHVDPEFEGRYTARYTLRQGQLVNG